MNSSKDGNDEELIWEEVSTEHIVKDKWMDFRKSVYRFPNGEEFGPYYSYSRRDYVVVIATDDEGKYICVKQFRQGIRALTTEFVAGGIERDDGREYKTENAVSDAENALEAAKRELLEETGYESDNWNHIITVPSNATIADNYAHVFRAFDCHKVTKQELDDTEFLKVVRYTDKEIIEMIEDGRFEQAIHIMGYCLSKHGLRDK